MELAMLPNIHQEFEKIFEKKERTELSVSHQGGVDVVDLIWKMSNLEL